MNQVVSVRVCPSDGKSCYFPSCSWIDAGGNVRVCQFVKNPHGRFKKRVVLSSNVGSPVFSKHRLRRSC